mmetsp:Transcript_13443/g.18395  ORF Transcript_13443/g.18395 Transcript_13443/m.18395 type:complete len:370 (-) Transcript_13443:95-1204(-)
MLSSATYSRSASTADSSRGLSSANSMGMSSRGFVLFVGGKKHGFQAQFKHHTGRQRGIVTQSALLGGLMEKAAALNAERLARKEGDKLLGSQKPVEELKGFPVHVLETKAKQAGLLLEQSGVLCLRGALASETCDELLGFINQESDQAKQAVLGGSEVFGERFGGVNCRGLEEPFGRRQDMFLSVEDPMVTRALIEAIGNLAPLLEATVTREGMLHEISCLVADPGSPRQCIHADTIYLPCPQYPVPMAPLYTFFFAVQDVEDGMGHTTFLPQTHTERAHELWNTTPGQKETFVASSAAVISSLKKGDVAIFDSRLLHCGGANTSDKRRVLFYFTASSAQRWPLSDGLHGSNSVRKEDLWQWRLCDFGM